MDSGLAPQQVLYALAINRPNGSLLVRVCYNGEIEYGPGYTPAKAARRFWDAMGLEFKKRTEG